MTRSLKEDLLHAKKSDILPLVDAGRAVWCQGTKVVCQPRFVPAKDSKGKPKRKSRTGVSDVEDHLYYLGAFIPFLIAYIEVAEENGISLVREETNENEFERAPPQTQQQAAVGTEVDELKALVQTQRVELDAAKKQLAKLTKDMTTMQKAFRTLAGDLGSANGDSS